MPSSERDIQIRRKRSRAEAERFPLSVTSQESRINRYAIPSRATVLHMVDIRTQPSHEQHMLVFEPRHRRVLIDFIDARIAQANGDSKPLDTFLKRVTAGNKEFEPETSKLVDDMGTHFRIVLGTFPEKEKQARR